MHKNENILFLMLLLLKAIEKIRGKKETGMDSLDL
jgi:hypothetical protein